MKKVLLLIALTSLLTACKFNDVTLCKGSLDNSQAIPMSELIIPLKSIEYSSVVGKELVFSMDGGFAAQVPFPQELLMFRLKRMATNNKITLIASEQTSYINDWNFYAAEKIFSGKAFDRRKERENYLKNNFGEASEAMAEYFRISERQIFCVGATCGTGTPSYPTVAEISKDDFLSDLETALQEALKVASSEKCRKAVEKELKFFHNYRQKLLLELDKNIRRAYANSGEKYEFSALYGDKADIETCFELKADENYLILTLTANETAPAEKRISKVQKRDFANMWAEDGFEFFLIPNKDVPNEGWQFIVNSRGSLWDARHSKVGSCDMTWSAENARVDFVELNGAWQATLTIPWSDLGFKEMPKQEFLANIYRNRAVHGVARKSFAWSPIYLGAYYQPGKFGRFIWDEVKK
jgi:hypothetical protein